MHECTFSSSKASMGIRRFQAEGRRANAMPTSKHTELPENLKARFRTEVERLIDARVLSALQVQEALASLGLRAVLE
jgi:hypothetical protein